MRKRGRRGLRAPTTAEKKKLHSKNGVPLHVKSNCGKCSSVLSGSLG